LTKLAKLAKIYIMKTVSIHDAKTNLSKYIAAAKKGEVIYIGSYGKPEVKLVVDTPSKPKRKFGLLKGKISSASLNYDKHSDKEWQKIVEDIYDNPIIPNNEPN